MTPHHTHLLMSVSKSIIGCVVGILIDRGALDPAQPITRYVPDLRSSGYADASLRDVLDMRSGVAFSETYLDPDADVRLLEQVMGWAPRRQDDLPTSIYDYLLRLKADRAARREIRLPILRDGRSRLGLRAGNRTSHA